MTAHTREIEIRPMTVADADAAARLSAELGYPVGIHAMAARIGDLLQRPEHGVFVACRGADVLGWIHVSSVQHLQSEARAEIGGLVVTEPARSEGIGARLVARAEAWALAHGFTSILVRSQIAREAAHRFYVREGYERTKTSAVFTKRLPTA